MKLVTDARVKYADQIEALRADIELTESYGGPIVGIDKLNAQKAELTLCLEFLGLLTLLETQLAETPQGWISGSI